MTEYLSYEYDGHSPSLQVVRYLQNSKVHYHPPARHILLVCLCRLRNDCHIGIVQNIETFTEILKSIRKLKAVSPVNIKRSITYMYNTGGQASSLANRIIQIYIVSGLLKSRPHSTNFHSRFNYFCISYTINTLTHFNNQNLILLCCISHDDDSIPSKHVMIKVFNVCS